MTAIGFDDFASPAASAGFVWEDHKGALLIVEPTRLEEKVPTTFGEKDAIRASITVVDGPGAGEVYPDSLVFPMVLIGQLRPNLGRKVLGRVGQGVAKPGQKAPWKLDDPTPADIAAGKAFLTSSAPRAAQTTAQAPF